MTDRPRPFKDRLAPLQAQAGWARNEAAVQLRLARQAADDCERQRQAAQARLATLQTRLRALQQPDATLPLPTWQRLQAWGPQLQAELQAQVAKLHQARQIQAQVSADLQARQQALRALELQRARRAAAHALDEQRRQQRAADDQWLALQHREQS